MCIRDSSTTAPSSTTATDTTLPQTGPADTLLSVIGVGALTAAGIFYYRSRIV